MRRALAIVVGVAMVCVVAYLSWLNPDAVEFRFTADRTVNAPLAAFIVFAFVAGVLLVLAVVMLQAGQRAILAWRHEREQRRSERIDRWEDRGEELVWQGDPQKGRALLQKASRRRPTNPYAVLALAASYQDTGEIQRARRLLSDAANQHRTNPDVLLALAEAHRAADDRIAALETLERLRALHPRAPRVLRRLRDAYVASGRLQDAVTIQEALVTELRDSEQSAREQAQLTTLRYRTSIELADATARLQALEALADNRSASIPVLVSLGDALRANGRDDEAAIVWERAVRSTPRTVLAHRLAQIATEQRHRDRLRAVLRKLRADQVHADNVRLLTAQLHLADGDVSAAAGELDAIEDLSAAPALFHRLRGDLHRRRGELEQAVTAYTRAEGPSWAHRCRVCHRTDPEWIGYCPQCGSWDSYRADVEISAQ